MSKISYQTADLLCMPNVHYIQHNNNSTTSSIIDEEEQERRNKLIQQATNRLRQKILEKKYETLMSQIVEIQSKLDIIKLETTISLKTMDSNHLDHFEKRLENHKFDLKNIIEKEDDSSSDSNSDSNSEDEEQEEQETNSSYSSFSSILSLNQDEDYFFRIGNGKKRRSRQQVQDEQSSLTPTSDIGRNELIVLHSIHDINNGLIKTPSTTYSLLDKRNALDDTLSFLNDLASDTDDGGFRKDIIELLQKNQPIITNISNNKNNNNFHFIKNPFSWLLSISWKWIRFALIMILAILINIKQGPSLF